MDANTNALWFGVIGDLAPDITRGIVAAVAATQAKVAAIQAGKCPECQQPMTLEKRGEQVYALPCGHRLYHGDLMPQITPDQAV